MDGDQERTDSQTDRQHVGVPIETPNGATHQPVPDTESSISEKAFVDRIKRSDRWMIILTAAIAFSGIVSAVIFGKQLVAMEGQLTEMQITRESSDKSMADQLKLMGAQSEAMAGQLAQMKAASEQTERAIGATNRLAEQANRSADETHRLADASSISNAITRQLADAAVQANLINKQSLLDVQRALMVFKGFEYEKYMPTIPNKGWTIFANFENSGNTPTLNLISRYRCELVQNIKGREDPYTDAYQIPTYRAADERGTLGDPVRLVFGPKQTKRIGGCPLNGGTPNTKDNPGYPMSYFFGRVEYRDVLAPKAVVHVTEFCYHIGYSTSMDVPSSGTIRPDVGACPTHNCTDEECGDDAIRQAKHDLGVDPQPSKQSTR